MAFVITKKTKVWKNIFSDKQGREEMMKKGRINGASGTKNEMFPD